MKSKDFNEITVEVSGSLEDLQLILNKNGFKKIEEYDLKDVYMIDSKTDLKRLPKEILKDCLLIRSCLDDVKLLYKWKEYNDLGEITKQGKVSCKVETAEKAEHLLNMIGWVRLMEINDHIIIYANDITELAVQLVNNHIYIEIEEYSRLHDKIYKNIDEIKKEFLKYNIPIKNNNYFVKKAEIELRELIEKGDNNE